MNLLAVVKNEMNQETKEAQIGDTRKGMGARTGYKINLNNSRALSLGFKRTSSKGFRSGFQWYEPPNRETTTNRQFISQIVSCLDETESRKRFWSPRKDSRARQKMFGENESRRSERKRDAAGNPRRRMALIGHGTVLGGNLVSGLLFPTPYCRASRTSASVA